MNTFGTKMNGHNLPKLSPPTAEIERHVVIIRTWVLWAILAGLLLYFAWALSYLRLGFGTALGLGLSGALTAGGAVAVGAFLGFLFGAPRTLQQEEPKEHRRSRQLVNTSLDEISSWLTKIIVGISLVTFPEIKDFFQGLVNDLAYLKDTVDGQPAVLAALILYSLVVGFVGMYLFARSYLAIVLGLAAQAMTGDEAAPERPAAPEEPAAGEENQSATEPRPEEQEVEPGADEVTRVTPGNATKPEVLRGAR